jgi:hypothetical protein
MLHGSFKELPITSEPFSKGRRDEKDNMLKKSVMLGMQAGQPTNDLFWPLRESVSRPSAHTWKKIRATFKGFGVNQVAARRYGTFETTLLFVTERAFHSMRLDLVGLVRVKLRVPCCNWESRALFRR